MKQVVLYSREWARRRQKLIDELSKECAALGVEFVDYNHFIFSEDTLKAIVSECPNGFNDIVKNTLTKNIQDMRYSQCIQWLFDDMDNRLTSIIYLYVNENGVSRIESGLPNIEYMLNILRWRKNNNL